MLHSRNNQTQAPLIPHKGATTTAPPCTCLSHPEARGFLPNPAVRGILPKPAARDIPPRPMGHPILPGDPLTLKRNSILPEAPRILIKGTVLTRIKRRTHHTRVKGILLIPVTVIKDRTTLGM